MNVPGSAQPRSEGDRDPTPFTAEQMARRLGFECPGVLRRNFPAQYQALLEKRTAYEEAQRKQLRSYLISALAENPAPTVLAVCARLGVSSSRIYFLHRHWPTPLPPDIYESRLNPWSGGVS